jgi:hypothetical protein
MKVAIQIFTGKAYGNDRGDDMLRCSICTAGCKNATELGKAITGKDFSNCDGLEHLVPFP